jgi:hypothetical protein
MRLSSSAGPISATSYVIGDGAVWNDTTTPGAMNAILQRGRLATRIAAVTKIGNGQLVVQIEQGSESALALRINGRPKDFPASGERSITEQRYRPSGE